MQSPHQNSPTYVSDANTIIFRPAFLRGAERPERRIAESVIGYVRAWGPGALIRVVSSVDSDAVYD
ncbi:hypothetical protein OG21DRAFT_1517338 [Imleria badia]|nr:hypothetical protein OG21DRAFT_1517338 [Imleria badia]